MYLFEHLTGPKCATGAVLPADYLTSTDSAYLPGFGPAAPEPSKIAWVPLAVGAVLVGGVLYLVAKGATPVLATNPSSSWESWAEKMVTMAELREPTRTGKQVSRETIENIKNGTSDPRTRMRAAVLLQNRYGLRANPLVCTPCGPKNLRLPDGVARRKGFTARDADPRELARGTRHELEHTTSRWVARQIALDHLAEDAHYYKKLERMEKRS